MYLKITTKCNMSCEHCINSCGKGLGGEHMGMGTFKKCLKLCEMYDFYPVLGGGEPTLHPKFWEIFGRAMGAEVELVWMATNGSIATTTKALARIAKGCEKFGVALSQDYYHDPIDESVVDLFKALDLEIRDVTSKESGIFNHGFAKINGVGEENDRCGCDLMQVEPNGTVRFCGCDNSPILGSISELLEDELLMENINTLRWRASDRGEECYKLLTPAELSWLAEGGLFPDDEEEQVA